MFRLKSLDFARETKVLAANQGLYNSFLSLGLLVSFIGNNLFYIQLFLAFVLIAGIVGSLTTKNIRLFLVQGLPALLALILIYLQ